MSKYIYTSMLCIASLIFSAYGQDSTRTLDLDKVIITANKFPQKQLQTGKVVQIIDRQELQRQGARTLGAILNTQAGLIVNGSENNLGSENTVYLRGAGSQNIVLLIDGIPMSDPSGIYLTFDIRTLHVNQIERVEILKGAQSTLYGSEASAGVINIITRKPDPGKLQSELNLSYGSFQTFNGALQLSGTLGKISYRVSSTYIQSGGFSAAKDTFPNLDFDKDAFSQNTYQAVIAWSPLKNWNLRAMALGNTFDTDLDNGAFQDDRDYTFDSDNLSLVLRSAVQLKQGNWITQYGRHQSQRDFLNDKTYVFPGSFGDFLRSQFEGAQDVAESYLNYRIGAQWNLLAGLDMRLARATQVSDFGFGESKLSSDSLKTEQYSPYLSAYYTHPKGFQAEIGARYNSHSLYGGNATYTFNPSLVIKEAGKLFLNLSSAYRAPSLDELYAPYGNRELEPERSHGQELGLQWNVKDQGLNLRLVGFSRTVRDLIVYVINDPNTFAGGYENKDKQQEQGLEFEAGWSIDTRTQLNANYTFLEGKTESDGETNRILLRRPKHAFNLNLSREWGKKWYTSLATRYMGKRYDFGMAPDTYLEPYITLDINFIYSLTPKIKIFVDARNIGDADYSDIFGFNSKPFNIMAGVNILVD